MGSPLGPILANIIMTKLEKQVIKTFVDDVAIKLHGRYVDDTLLVIKPKDMERIHQALNKFEKNLRFSVDKFDDVVSHLLDLELRDEMMLLLFIQNQLALVYMLIITAMSHGLLDYHGLKVLLQVQRIFVHQSI